MRRENLKSYKSKHRINIAGKNDAILNTGNVHNIHRVLCLITVISDL